MSRNNNPNINRPKIIVFTEDSKSSNIYLTEFNRKYRNKFIVQAISKNCGGNPLKLLYEAIKELKKKRQNYNNIKFVCILFDLDKREALDSYKIVKQKAEVQKIEVYVFDPNFEYYHINHFMQFYKGNFDEKLKKHYNMEIDEIKKDIKIYKNLVKDEELIKNAITNCKNNKTNKTNFYNLIELLLNN